MWGISSYTAPSLHAHPSLSDWKGIYNIITIIMNLKNREIHIVTFFDQEMVKDIPVEFYNAWNISHNVSRAPHTASPLSDTTGTVLLPVLLKINSHVSPWVTVSSARRCRGGLPVYKPTTKKTDLIISTYIYVKNLNIVLRWNKSF